MRCGPPAAAAAWLAAVTALQQGRPATTLHDISRQRCTLMQRRRTSKQLVAVSELHEVASVY